MIWFSYKVWLHPISNYLAGTNSTYTATIHKRWQLCSIFCMVYIFSLVTNNEWIHLATVFSPLHIKQWFIWWLWIFVLSCHHIQFFGNDQQSRIWIHLFQIVISEDTSYNQGWIHPPNHLLPQCNANNVYIFGMQYVWFNAGCLYRFYLVYLSLLYLIRHNAPMSFRQQIVVWQCPGS